MNEQVNDTPESGMSAPVPVGTQLRQAREAAGQDVATVAAVLRLGERQVEALENGDWSALPGHTFVRGFVRNYARHLGLDPQPLMTQLDALSKPANVLDVQADAPAPVSFGGSSLRRDRHVLIGGVAAVIVAVLVYFLLPENLEGWRADVQGLIDSLARQEAPAAPETQPVTPAAQEPVFPPGTTPQQIMNPQVLMPEPVQPATPQSEAVPSAPAAVEKAPEKAQDKRAAGSSDLLVVTAEKMSWLEIRDREKRVVFSQRLAAGSQQTIPGDGPLNLTIGYAPGIRLTWRGQVIDLEPFTRGDVARLVLE